MTYFLHIRAVQEPFEIGSDENGRTMFSCNYDCSTGSNISDLEREILGLISDADIVSESNRFVGMSDSLPLPTSSTDGPFVRIIRTSGYGPQLVRGSGSASMKRRPSVQIITYSTDADLSSSAAQQIFELLAVIDQQTVTV